MVSLMIVSHSKMVVEGIKTMVLEMNGNLPVYAVGGTKDGRNGSDYDLTKASLLKAMEDGPVVVLFDIGSTMMTILMILEELTQEQRKKVFLSDGALVEGAIIAAACMNTGMTFDQILAELSGVSLEKL